MQNKTVCVVGLGYIGLPTAALLANSGYQVIGVDVDPAVVEIINQGKIHIIEPDLDSFVQSAVFSGKLKVYTTPQAADIFMLCVPTPFYANGEIPEPNLEYVLTATQAIAPYLKAGNIVILESTSPVGTTAQVYDILKTAGVDVENIFIAYCPERVLPGKIMVELIDNDRIVGGINQASTRRVKAFYQTFVRGEVLETDSQTAEMSKLVENSYRDVNIAFANELSLLCDTHRINVYEVIRLANHHPRVNILQPGCGV
ncbi:UDP-N-acetyl-D-mannosaminuronic acid dehydrogenase, partial [Candidatus Thiomargarita nelsonii]